MSDIDLMGALAGAVERARESRKAEQIGDRKEGAFALAQHNAYTVMRNDPGIWNDSLRRALESVLPMVWDEAQAAALAEQVETEWEFSWGGDDWVLDAWFDTEAEARDAAKRMPWMDAQQGKLVRRRKAGPWMPVPDTAGAES